MPPRGKHFSTPLLLVILIAAPALTATPAPPATHLEYTLALKPGPPPPIAPHASTCTQMLGRAGLKPGRLLFEIDLVPLKPGNYTMTGSEVSITASGPPPAWACASADEATLTVDVLGEEDGRTAVRLTLTFKNLVVATGKPQERLFEALLHSPPRRGAWRLGTYSISRLILVDKATGEAFDKATGRPLGEWPLWLPAGEFKSRLSLILASIDFQEAYFYTGGAGFTATLLLLNSSETDGDYTFTLNGKPVAVKAPDTAVARSLPFAVVYQQVPRAPPPSVEKTLAAYGCTVRRLQGHVEVACDKLLEAYRAGSKPWSIRLSTVEYRGAPMKQLVVDYRGLMLTPNQAETYRAVYWKATGLLLYIEEDTSVYGATPGFLPPPASDYLLWNNTAIVFRSLEAPVSLRLVSAETPAPPRSPAGQPVDMVLLAAAAALLIPLLIAFGRPLKRWARRAAIHASPPRPRR